MVPMQNFSLKQYRRENSKYNKRDGFLHYFKLHKRERSPVSGKANPVCRDLAQILKKSYRPTEHNYPNCPYQAKVMNILDITNKPTVYNAFIPSPFLNGCKDIPFAIIFKYKNKDNSKNGILVPSDAKLPAYSRTMVNLSVNFPGIRETKLAQV